MSHGNPFWLPADGRRFWTVNVSGGRSSGMLLHRVLDAHDGALPAHSVAAFSNTGRERGATLDFIAEMSRRWSVPITWLEYRFDPDARGSRSSRRHTWREVDHGSAARNGEPFEAMIRHKRMLPSVHRRVCTQKLKIEPLSRYIADTRGVPLRRQVSVLGIRADEQRRLESSLFGQCRTFPPLAIAGVTAEDVAAFWSRQPFDLELPDGADSNCDLCPLKGVGQLTRLVRREPHLVDWWIKMEEEHAARTGSDLGFQIRSPGGYRGLRHRAMSQAELPLVADDPPIADCFCGGD